MTALTTSLFTLRPEGWTALLAIMLPLSLLMAWTLVRAALHRRAEGARLLQLRERLRPVLATDEPPESGEVAEEMLAAVQAFPEASVVRRAVVAATRSSALASPDMQGATEAVTATLDGQLSLVRNVPNMLMLAGLLGTVFGLAGSLGSLRGPIANAASADSPASLAGALGNTLSVMQGAFGASLWGILLSLLGSALYTFAARRQEAFQDDLAAFVHAELVPAIFPRAMTAQMERMGRYLRDAGNSFRDIHERLQGVAGQLEEVLGRAGETLEGSLTQLAETSTQVERVFGSMDESVRELTTGLSKGVGDLVLAQESAATSLRASSAEMGGQLAGQARVIGQLHETVTTRTEVLLQRLDGVTEAMGRAAKNFEQAGLTVRAEQSEYVGRLERGFENVARTLAAQAGPPALAPTALPPSELAQPSQTPGD
jgi:biopolymer transport protein ExbB/TolQ